MGRGPGRTGHAWREARAWVLDQYDRCWICLHEVDKTLDGRQSLGPSVDHAVPLSRGGDPLDRANLRLAHTGCNSRRKDATRAPSRRSRAW